jgi:hypothetical protein
LRITLPFILKFSIFSSTDDPVSQTIGWVMELSGGAYTLDQVTVCVHRMWDVGLQYDSVEAVMKELKNAEVNGF